MRLPGAIVGVLVWPLLAWAGTGTAADPERPRQVLLLYAESRLLPGLIEADAAFRSTVGSSLGAPVGFQQVILNLALNAQAAMADGRGEPRRLTVETAAGVAGTVEVWIRDTGAGVEEDDLEHIFEPFVTTKAAGLGMGLSISRSIVEAHGGTIRAERNPDRGLSVHVALPCGAGP